MIAVENFTDVEKIEFLVNIRRARELVDYPCLVVGEWFNIPLTERGRKIYLSLLDEAERYAETLE
ncbi:MAG: hypothetical protein ACOX5A_07975 [Aminivibrio sp.]|jgi:hypothetical protein